MKKYYSSSLFLILLSLLISVGTSAQQKVKSTTIINTANGIKTQVREVTFPVQSNTRSIKKASNKTAKTPNLLSEAETNTLCPTNITVNNDAGECGAVVNYTVPTCIGQTLTQTSPNLFTSTFRVVCTDFSGNASYLRAYNLPALGITDGFTLTSVDFDAYTLADVSVTVNVYQWEHRQSALDYSNLSLLSTAVVNIPIGTASTIRQPISAVLPRGYGVVIEIVGDPNFYIGSGPSESTGGYFTYPPECDDPSHPIRHVSDIADNKIIINAHGCAGGTITQTNGLSSGSLFPVATTFNEFQTEGGATCSFAVTVNDNEPPTFTAPAGQDVPLDANCSITIPDLTTGLTGTDNCGDVTFTQDPLIGTVINSAHNQPTKVTITAQDSHGNTTPLEVILTAKDVTDPTITAPADVNVNTDPGVCSASHVDLGTPTYGDNCSGATVSNDSPATFPVGTTTVTWTVTDGANNTATATQTVTVTDNEKPVVACPAIPVQCYNDRSTYTIPSLTASDNCGISTVTYAITGATTRNGNGNNASGRFNPGTSIITWMVTDVHNNSNNCQSTVMVNKAIYVYIPDAKAECKGVEENMVYKGYAPASSITLSAKASGGSGSFTYKWSTGATTSSIKVSPTSTTAYTVTVTDVNNCTGTALRIVKVENVLCDDGRKVEVCQRSGNRYSTICVASKDVEKYLDKGAYLGDCKTSRRDIKSEDEQPVTRLTLKASPNPTSGFFNLTVNSTNATDKVTIRVIDEVGRTVELRTATSGQTVQIGPSYIHGMYFVQAVQGSERATVKLVKQ